MKKTNLIQATLLAAAVTFFSGCASVPSPEKMQEETAGFQLPKQPEEGKALVYVVRPSIVGTLVRFNVFVDNEEAASEMGYNRGSQYIYFNVTPGEHKILSKAENWAETAISAKAGDVIFIKQDPAMGIIMARNDISKIESLEGRYHVKNTALGTIIKTDK